MRGLFVALLAGHRNPKGWHAIPKTVVRHGETVGEEILTRGSARIVGDIAN